MTKMQLTCAQCGGIFPVHAGTSILKIVTTRLVDGQTRRRHWYVCSTECAEAFTHQESD